MLNKIDIIVKESILEVLSDINKNNFDLDSLIFFGEDGILDSIGLVTLTVILEEKIENTFNTDILLADEKAFSNYNSPFRDLKSLSKYIEGLLMKQRAMNHG